MTLSFLITTYMGACIIVYAISYAKFNIEDEIEREGK